MPFPPFLTPRPSALLRASAFLSLLLAGCKEETTVIAERGLLIGLPEAQRAGQQTKSTGVRANPLETVHDSELIVTAVTGERVLICQSPRHVIVLTRRLLSSPDEADGVLFYNQLVSDDTKRRAIKEGEDPARILEYFKENRADIFDLLNAMPMGELSPNVAYEPVDDGSGKDRARLRVRASSGLSRKLEFTELWVQREGRNQYRLLWVR